MPLIPVDDSICRIILWSRVSKAEYKSITMSIVSWVLLSLDSKFDDIMVSAVSVDLCGNYHRNQLK